LAVEHRLERQLFADKAQNRPKPGQRHRRQTGDGGGDRHGPPQPAQPLDIARAGLVIQCAGDHKQRALVERVRQ
jgi:hypothetical protein